MCLQHVVICSCTTCLAEPVDNRFTGIYYDVCEDIELASRIRASYGDGRETYENRIARAENHVEAKYVHKGRAWVEERDSGLLEERVWTCGKSGWRFVEDEEAKGMVVDGDVAVPQGLGSLEEGATG